MYNFKSIVSIMRYVILLMTPIPYMDHSVVTVKGHHQIANTERRLIIFFAAQIGGVLYSQQKQDLELAVAQTVSSLLKKIRLKQK